MVKSPLPFRPLAELGAYLVENQETILESWQQACEKDPSLPTIITLTRHDFTDRVPDLLTVLSQRLEAQAELALTNRLVAETLQNFIDDPILLAR